MAHMLCVADSTISGQFIIHWENFGVELNDYPLEKALIWLLTIVKCQI